jgi:hypothetical protein
MNNTDIQFSYNICFIYLFLDIFSFIFSIRNFCQDSIKQNNSYYMEPLRAYVNLLQFIITLKKILKHLLETI